MFKEKSPFLSAEFLDELVEEINQQYGGPIKEQITDQIDNDLE